VVHTAYHIVLTFICLDTILQVVAAVGFKGRRLEIPKDLNPLVAALIESCWANEPWRRPSFTNIMETLRPLIKVPVPQLSRSDL